MQLIASLNPVAGGKYTVNIPQSALAGITTTYYKPDGSPAQRPAQFGDVYSFQPDSVLVGRPAGTAGAWEIVTLDGLFVSIQPDPVGPVYRYSFVNLS